MCQTLDCIVVSSASDPFVPSSVLSPSDSNADLLYASAVAAEETCEGDDDVLGLTHTHQQRQRLINPHLINSLHSRLVQQRKQQQLFHPQAASSSRVASHVDESSAPAHLTDHMYEHLYEEVEIDTDVHLGPDGKPLRKRGESSKLSLHFNDLPRQLRLLLAAR